MSRIRDDSVEVLDPRSILPTLSRSELELIIRERLSEGDDALGKLALSLGAKKADKRTPVAIVQSFLRRHGEKYGFIEDSYGFSVDQRRLFVRAAEAAENGNQLFAVELTVS